MVGFHFAASQNQTEYLIVCCAPSQADQLSMGRVGGQQKRTGNNNMQINNKVSTLTVCDAQKGNCRLPSLTSLIWSEQTNQEDDPLRPTMTQYQPII